jgi:hypothetical protein
MHPNPEDQIRELHASLVRTERVLASAKEQQANDQVTIWILVLLLEQLRGKLAKAVEEIREHNADYHHVTPSDVLAELGA